VKRSQEKPARKRGRERKEKEKEKHDYEEQKEGAPTLVSAFKCTVQE
jgi:hypothetical protein